MRSKIALAVLITLISSAVFGRGLDKKYKKWPKSPQAYFLTNSEKEAWNDVKTNEEAEKFIQDYLDRRGPDFQKMLNKRIEEADKYFSSGKTPGSETLRGKVVIVFGAPTSISAAGGPGQGSGQTVRNVVASAGADPGGGNNASIDAGSAGGGGNPMFSSHSSGGHLSDFPVFTFVYDASAAPKAIGKEFNVDLAMESNTEQLPIDEKGLDAKFEAVAEASISKDQPKAPPAG